ncbi:MAG: endonuclease [Ruminococcaceae bacterium]|jgi:endonuclease/exonuclease/phosphatase family metal-dependent hydrolase|nr:endonuclease [Oscillospiraceae bacterium]
MNKRRKAMKNKEKKQRSVPFKIFRVIGIVLLVIIVAFAGLIGFLSATEYRPKEKEEVEIQGNVSSTLSVGDSFKIMSWNIGYGALGDNADFFMDGGTSVKTADTERVNSNMQGIINEITKESPDIFFLQEADKNSSRSNHINELGLIQDVFSGYNNSFANNFKVAYLPYPVPPMGKVDSGIATFSSFGTTSAERIQLPVPFSWPVRMANLKRCLLVSRVKIENSDKELVLVNLHLEAYDDGEGKIAQTKMLSDFLSSEAEKGNYVIAGGDFNQIFSSADTSAYPAQEGKWAAGEIDVNEFGGDWQFLMDSSVPSCRSLDQPYENADKDTFQYYLIDGFIVSKNIEVESFENVDMGFVCSDHNPVVLNAKLG